MTARRAALDGEPWYAPAVMAAAARACRRPRRGWQRRLMLAAAMRVTGASDWVAYRASMVVAELEDLDT